jgi:hypothetical protein
MRSAEFRPVQPSSILRSGEIKLENSYFASFDNFEKQSVSQAEGNLLIGRHVFEAANIEGIVKDFYNETFAPINPHVEPTIMADFHFFSISGTRRLQVMNTIDLLWRDSYSYRVTLGLIDASELIAYVNRGKDLPTDGAVVAATRARGIQIQAPGSLGFMLDAPAIKRVQEHARSAIDLAYTGFKERVTLETASFAA